MSDWEKDDLGPEDYEHFDFNEKWDRHGNLISVEVKQNDITHGLLDSLFSKTDDDHEHRKRANKKGELLDDEVEFTDQYASIDELFGQAQETDPVDQEWWGWQQIKGTDPEDESDEIVRNVRVHRMANSACDPTGMAIYHTKAVRRQLSGIKSRRNKRLDPYSTRKKPRKQSDKDIERYLADKYRKAGKQTPDTVEGWNAIIAAHKAQSAERRLKAEFRAFIGWRFNCKTRKAYNLIKEITDGSGMWTEETFSALIDEFNRLRNGAGAPPWAKPKRCPEQADECVFGDLRFSPPVRFDEW